MTQTRLLSFGLTILALVAFAANSIICRLALKSGSIDASSFTVIRLISGVLMFLILISLNSKTKQKPLKIKAQNLLSGVMLFTYAIAFSFAYVSLETGTGALILFGSVQITMISMNIYSGNRLSFYEIMGLFMAFIGLVYLVLPGLSSPSLPGFILMLISGIAWGHYTISGKNSTEPFYDTAFNFVCTLPLVLILLILILGNQILSAQGIIYAILSGAFASALGYTIWFKALAELSTTEASVVQLSVPVIAAFGGLFFVSELISQRLIVATVLVIGGILIVIKSKKHQK